jgi:16S rRNA (guanine527-N7)-methyltransferase
MTDVPRETSDAVNGRDGDVSRETSDRDLAPGELPPLPPAASEIFGDRLPEARAYARLLATDGVIRGLLGPREVPRLWDRHMLNCAVVAELIPLHATVTDVGSGAGLPGIPLALARPDLDIELLEPLERRVIFLQEVVAVLGLERVRVQRGRAEIVPRQQGLEVVTARAVAPLSRLARWCLPLLRPGGSLIALKGARAQEELDGAADELRRLGAVDWRVESCGRGLVDPPTTVVRVVLGDRRPPPGGRSAQRGTRGRA